MRAYSKGRYKEIPRICTDFFTTVGNGFLSECKDIKCTEGLSEIWYKIRSNISEGDQKAQNFTEGVNVLLNLLTSAPSISMKADILRCAISMKLPEFPNNHTDNDKKKLAVYKSVKSSHMV